MQALQTAIGDYQLFLRSIIGEVIAAGFDLNDFVQLDHMCYRTTSMEGYAAKKVELSLLATLLDEIQVNGRPIAVFRFKEPIFYDRWRIDAIEVPAPREGKSFEEGLEHIEFVLFDDQKSFLQKYTGKEFGLDAAERGVNPEISFKLPHFSVKFHLLNLPTVVYLERKFGQVDI